MKTDEILSILNDLLFPSIPQSTQASLLLALVDRLNVDITTKIFFCPGCAQFKKSPASEAKGQVWCKRCEDDPPGGSNENLN